MTHDPRKVSTTSPSLSAPPDRRRTITITAVFLAFWLVWLAALGWLRFTHPGLDHGDPTTDANILHGGENFDRHGWRSSFGVPAIDTYRPDASAAAPTPGAHQPDWYTTYPPGAYWLHQVVKSLGVTRLSGFRLFSLAISGLAVLIYFALLRRLSGDPLPAAIACVLYMTAKPFTEYADNLHYIALSQLTLMGSLYAWARCESADSPRASGLWLIVAWISLFLDAWLTFEHTLFVLAFAAIRSVWTRRPARLIAAAILAAAPALVLALRVLLNRAVLGSFEAVFALFRAKAVQRVGSADAGTGLRGLIEAWWPRLAAPGSGLRPGTPDGEFSMPALAWRFAGPVLALAVVSAASWHLPGMTPIRRAIGSGLLLLLCGLAWFVAMTEHAIHHRFTAMLLLPGIAALAGALIAGGLMQRRFHPPGAPIRHIARILALVAAVSWLAQVKSSFALNRVMKADESVRRAVHARDASLAAFAAAGRNLDGVHRLCLFSHDAPAARALGRPFDNTPGFVRPALTEHEALLIPLWSPAAHFASVQAAGSLGLPDQLSHRIEPYLLFRSGCADADRCGLRTNTGLTIERMAWRRLVDHSGWMFIAIVRADDVPAFDRLTRQGVVLELSGRRGSDPDPAIARMEIDATLGEIRLPAAGGPLRDQASAIVRFDLPDAALQTVRSVRLRTGIRGRPRTWGFEPASLRDHAAWKLSPNSAEITWPTPPWQAQHPPEPAVER